MTLPSRQALLFIVCFLAAARFVLVPWIEAQREGIERLSLSITVTR
jgi:hypothetical protein